MDEKLFSDNDVVFFINLTNKLITFFSQFFPDTLKWILNQPTKEINKNSKNKIKKNVQRIWNLRI